MPKKSKGYTINIAIDGQKDTILAPRSVDGGFEISVEVAVSKRKIYKPLKVKGLVAGDSFLLYVCDKGKAIVWQREINS